MKSIVTKIAIILVISRWTPDELKNFRISSKEKRNEEEWTRREKNPISDELKIRFQRSFSVICQRAFRNARKSGLREISQWTEVNPSCKDWMVSSFLKIKLRVVNPFSPFSFYYTKASSGLFAFVRPTESITFESKKKQPESLFWAFTLCCLSVEVEMVEMVEVVEMISWCEKPFSPKCALERKLNKV